MRHKLTEALDRVWRESYREDGDAPFTSGNLTTQRADPMRLPLAESVRLDNGDAPLFLVGLSRVGDEEAVGP